MLKIGVVGKPNVGKSSTFKALTNNDVLIANYPFATIDPNKGIAYVSLECVDKEFNVTCNPREGFCLNGKRFVPIELIDVAGLVPGAHEGKGLGNQFLDDLRQAHGLILVVDVSGSTNEKGEPVKPGSFDPADDIKFLEKELDAWWFGIFNKLWQKFARSVWQQKQDVVKAIVKQFSGLRVKEEVVKEVIQKLNLSENLLEWDTSILTKFVHELRIRTQPLVVLANKIDVETGRDNFERLKKEFPEHLIIPGSALAELALKELVEKNKIFYVPGENSFDVKAELDEKERNILNYIKTNILDVYGSTGLQEVLNKLVFEKLNYIAVFPGGVNKLADKDGNVLPDCFLLPKGSTALDFARQIHEDLAKGFIKAIDVRTKKPLGKNYVLKHRDVIEIVSKT